MPGLSFLSKKKWHTGKHVNQEAVWLAEQRAKERIIDEKVAIEEIQAKIAQHELASDDNGKSEVRFLYECPNEKINQLDAMNKKSLENGLTIEDPLVVEFRNKLENVSNEKEIKNVDQIEQIVQSEEESISRKKKKRRHHDHTTDPLDYINEILYTIDNDDFGELDVNLIATLQKKKQKKLLKRILEIEKNDKNI